MPRFFQAILILLLLSHPPTLWAAETLEVKIEGVADVVLENVRKLLSIEQQKTDPTLFEARIRRLHRNAPGEIKQALEPFGYYEPVISAKLTRQTTNQWLATYHIVPGFPVRVSSIDLKLLGEGLQDEQFQQLTTHFPLHEGDVLEHARYEEGKRALLVLATEHGYRDAQLLAHEIRVHPAQYTADIVLHFDTGRRYRFGTVTFIQSDLESDNPSNELEKSNAELSPDFLARFVTFEKGTPYSTERLFDLQNALTDSDYFDMVEMKPRPDLIEHFEIPLDVELDPRSKHRYTAGLGYGTDTGIRGSLGWENRRVNRRGHRFKSEIKISEIKKNITAKYRIPMSNPRTDRIELTSAWLYENSDISESETFLVGASNTLHRGSGWLETMYLNFQTESFTIANDQGNSSLLLPGISWSRVDADNRIYTRKGLRLLVDIKGTHPTLGSKFQFLQLRLQGKLIRPMMKNGRVTLRGDAGLSRIKDFAELPASLRFFAGGDQSVRGYDYNSLGPIDASGRVVGGEQLLVGSAEYEYSWTEKWSSGIFFDIGNAVDDWAQKLKQGAGFGVRWKSPVGLVRMDLAWALSDVNNPMRFHLVIGPDL